MNVGLLVFIIFYGIAIFVGFGIIYTSMYYEIGFHYYSMLYMILFIFFIGFIAWFVGHVLSFHIAKLLFRIQTLSFVHLEFNSSVLGSDRFFIVNRKRNKIVVFFIILFISLSLSNFIAGVLVGLTDNNEYYDSIFRGGPESRIIVLSMFLFPISTPMIYAIYILDFSNLRIELLGKKVISSVSPSLESC